MENLPVEIACFDVTEAFRFTTRQEYHIGRYKFVVLHSDDVSDPDISPGFGLERGAEERQHFGLVRVQLPIGCMSFLLEATRSRVCQR